MLKFIPSFCLRLILLLALLFGMLAFLVATLPGTKLTLRITNHFLPGTLRVHHLQGSLWRQLSFDALTYTDKTQHILLGKTKLKWHLDALYPLNIILETLEVTQITHTKNKTQILLDSLKFNGNFKNILRLNGDTRLILPQGVLNLHVATHDDLITGFITLGKNKLTFKGTPQSPWTLQAHFSDLKQLHPALAKLNSTFIAEARITDFTHATLKAHLTPGSYMLPKDSALERITFKSSMLNAKLTPEALTLDATYQLDDAISGKLALTLPNVRLDKTPPKTQAISGYALLQARDLKFLDLLNQLEQLDDLGLTLQSPSGKINAKLDISGVLNQPKLVGYVALNEGKVTLPDLGITLDPVAFQLKTDGTTWETRGILKPTTSSPITFSGTGLVNPSPTGKLTLTGNEVLIMSTPAYQVKISPELQFTATNDTYAIDGNILIPFARISPVSFIHTTRLTHDAVFSDEAAENPNPFNLTSHITLSMGDDVQINLKGIQGHVDGQLAITQLPKQPLSAVGEIKLRDGYYEAYGQKLHIEQGELIFLGQQIDNPNLRVRAVRDFKQTNARFSGSNKLFDFSTENLSNPNLGENTTVGITATGRIDSPNVKLFSSPPNLSQADILSMLLLGKPAEQASKSGGHLLIQAMTSMHLDSGTKGMKMLQDLQKATGVDFHVENKSLGTESSDFTKTSVSVGKSITKRVYLQYNVGLFQENSSVFTLTYLLNKFLSIKVTASDIGNGIDVMYSHSD